MKRKEQSFESRIAEHEKYRRQCKIRIRPALNLSAILTIALGFVTWKFSDGWKVALPILCLAYVFTGMEIIGYYRNDREITKLLELQKETANKKNAPDLKAVR
jgi:hypothetical protein